MRFTRGLVLALASMLLLGVGAAQGQGPNPPGLNGNVSGVVPALGKAHNDASRVSGFGRLYYHSGGSVMTTNSTYAIYWDPAGSLNPTYRTLIDGFLGDVAADSGKTSNVYWSDTQYYQSIGGATSYVKYASTFAGSVVDTQPFPTSGNCTDTVAQTSVCLTDVQLQAEIARVISTTPGWSAGPTRLFFIFTPKGVGSCYDSSNCAFSQFCAYHSHFGSGSTVTLYANQPYTDTVPANCDVGQHPNGSEADPTINVVSHEHNEAITDALGNAWYDLAGYENGDKCAWNFGAALGGGAGAQYNQMINGHTYYLQQEYSNARRNCVLTGT
jgi:hypothetical protein